jgi:hypothetical protein
MAKLPDDVLFEQFNRRNEDDFAGLARMIAERLREGIDERGAKWLAELFDPTESNLHYEAKISRRTGHKKSNEIGSSDDFHTFYDAYYNEEQEIDRTMKNVMRAKWQGGPAWDRDKAYKYRKIFLEYLDSQRG